MSLDSARGHLEIDFPSDAFHSAPRTLGRACKAWAANLGWIAAITLVVFVPVKLLFQWAGWMVEISEGSIGAYLLDSAGDLLAGAVAAPAVVYGMVERLRNGRRAPLGECLGWGMRSFARYLWTDIRVQVTVTLWGALLLVPGIIAMVRLALAGMVVAVEGESEPRPLDRSKRLTEGRRWRVFGVAGPLLLLELLPFAVLGEVRRFADSRVAFAFAESLLAIAMQLGTVAALLLYLGLVPAKEPKPARKQSRGKAHSQVTKL